MARLYAATGDAIARLDESGEAWTVELCLPGSGAQCLAVDPKDPDTVYAGLREGGVRRTVDAGRTWFDCALPEPGVFSLAVSAADGAVYVGTEPSRLFRSDDALEDAPRRSSNARRGPAPRRPAAPARRPAIGVAVPGSGGFIERSTPRASARRWRSQQRGSARSPEQTTARQMRGRARGRAARDQQAEGRAPGPASRCRR